MWLRVCNVPEWESCDGMSARVCGDYQYAQTRIFSLLCGPPLIATPSTVVPTARCVWHLAEGVHHWAITAVHLLPECCHGW